MSDWGMPDRPQRAFNSVPDKRKGRLATSGKSKPTDTRCTYYIDGAILCDVFPSWPVPGTKRERRCEQHRAETEPRGGHDD